MNNNSLHPTGFEPVSFHWKTDYESGAFNHSATNACFYLKLYEKNKFFLILNTDRKQEWIRTIDLQSRKLMLYPLSYMLLEFLKQ